MTAPTDTLFLSAQAVEVRRLEGPLFGKVVTSRDNLNGGEILFLHPSTPEFLIQFERFAAVICAKGDPRIILLSTRDDLPLVLVEPETVFSDGDVITVSPQGRIHRQFRAQSRNNAFLVTEVCNNLCLMCPQPPKPEEMVNHADTERRVLRTLELIETRYLPDSLCITGGEPTMLRDGLIRIVEKITERAPDTLIHLLTNGRYLSHEPYTARLAGAAKQQLLAGIPLFGHVADIHDYVVQSRGAFDQTMTGLLNCYRQGISVELRIVLQKITVEYLVELAEFIAHNLFFVKHVALMGMENMGYARLNRETVFVDPWEYKDVLSEAVRIFTLYGIEARIFNLPLCVVNEDTRRHCAKSISDFKNSWHSACERCGKRDECCGFFSSTTDKFFLTHHISPFMAE